MDLAECRAHLLRSCATVLDNAGLTLLILHGADEYPGSVESDLDVISEEPRAVPLIVAASGHADVVQAVEMGPDAFYYVVHRACNGRPALAALDVQAGFGRGGVRFNSRAELLTSSVRVGEVARPAAELEFISYLLKKIVKRELNAVHGRRLSALYGMNPAACRNELRRFFGRQEVELLANAASSDSWGDVQTRISALRRSAMTRRRLAAPITALGDWCKQVPRLARRLIHPVGLHVAIVGRDAAAAARVVDEVAEDLEPTFWQVHRRHGWVDVPSGWFASWTFRLRNAARPIIDFGLFWATIYPRLVRPTLVVTTVDALGRGASVHPGPWGLVILLDAQGPAIKVQAGGRLRSKSINRMPGANAAALHRAIRDAIVEHMRSRTARRLGLVARAHEPTEHRARTSTEVRGPEA